MQRGHSVALAVNSDLADWAGRAGLDVFASRLDVGGFLNSAPAQRFLANGRFATLVRRVTRDERRVNDSIVRACVESTAGADLVLSTVSMSFRAECIAAARGIPSGNLFCYPFPATGQWSSLLAGARELPFAWANRASFHAFYRMLWRQSRANVDDMCDALRLPQFRWRPAVENRPSVHTYSPALVPTPPEWGAQHEIVGAIRLSPTLRRRLGEDAIRPSAAVRRGRDVAADQ